MMATWSVTPSTKKSVIERRFMRKGKHTLVVEIGYRWGQFMVYTKDDTMPFLPEGVDIYNCEYETEIVDTIDACWEEYDMTGCGKRAKEWLEEFLYESKNSHLDLEEHGWKFRDTKMILEGKLTIEKVND